MNVRITNIQVPAQVRFDLGNLEEMKVSLQTHGLLHPILVRQLSESSYELVAGYRRLKVAESLGWTDIPVTVLNPKDTLNQFDISRWMKTFNAKISMSWNILNLSCTETALGTNTWSDY